MSSVILLLCLDEVASRGGGHGGGKGSGSRGSSRGGRRHRTKGYYTGQYYYSYSGSDRAILKEGEESWRKLFGFCVTCLVIYVLIQCYKERKKMKQEKKNNQKSK